MVKSKVMKISLYIEHPSTFIEPEINQPWQWAPCIFQFDSLCDYNKLTIIFL